jgi:WD40 repeat protein
MSDRIDQLASAADGRELAELMDWSAPGVTEAGTSSPVTGAEHGVIGDPSETSGARIGRYTILEKIGEGGFGTVFMAEQQHPVRRTVALKILKAGMDTKQVIARFEAERQALAMMDHPNVAKVLDAGATDAGRPYFVMDLIRGTPITRYCDEHKLTIRQRLELFLQVCQGVQHAHTKGIIHRDLKPSNVLVAESDGKAVPKVIDFGIAKATTGQLIDQTLITELRQFLGTPQYMSPEQADGSADIDTRSDVYSLGVILYELLSGATPFDFKTSGFAEIHRIIREVDPPPPSTRAGQRELKGDLDRIVLKAMEKDRTRRYETASALATDIQRYLNNEPVTARQAGRIYRFRKLVRRNKLAFAAGTALVLTLAIGLITSAMLYLKARDAKTAQSILRDDAEAYAYASDMLGIQQALAANNLGRARTLLDRHRPKSGEKDRRGWEWRYLWQQCRGDEMAILTKRPAPISSLSVSADGRWLAIGEGADGGLTVCDLQQRTQPASLPAGEGEVRVAFSPHGQLLAYTSVTFDAQKHQHVRVHLREIGDHREKAATDLNDYANGLAFALDGKTLVSCTAGLEGELSFWRVPELVKIASVPAPSDYLATDFAVTGDLRSAALTSKFERPGRRLRRIQVTGENKWEEDTAPSAATSIVFSRDGRVLAFAVGTSNPVIQLREPATGASIGPPFGGHVASITQLVFWPDGKTLASASADQTIRLWDIRDAAHPKAIGRPLRGHTQEVKRLALLADNRTLISGAKDGSVCRWDTTVARQDLTNVSVPMIGWSFEATGAAVLSVRRGGQVLRHDGHNPLLTAPVWNIPSDASEPLLWGGRLLLARCGDHGYTVDLVTKDVFPSIPPVDGVLTYSTVTPQYHWVGYVKGDDTVRERDLRTGSLLPEWRIPGGLATMAFNSDGERRLALAADGSGILTEISSGRETRVNLDTTEVVSACFSSDGRLIAIASGSGYVGVWPIAALAARGRVPPMRMLGGFMAAPHSVAISPDNRRLAAGAQGNETVKLYDIPSGEEVLTLASRGTASRYLGFSPDGTVLAASDTEERLHIWRAPTLAEIEATEAFSGPPAIARRTGISGACDAAYGARELRSSPAVHPPMMARGPR